MTSHLFMHESLTVCSSLTHCNPQPAAKRIKILCPIRTRVCREPRRIWSQKFGDYLDTPEEFRQMPRTGGRDIGCGLRQ